LLTTTRRGSGNIIAIRKEHEKALQDTALQIYQMWTVNRSPERSGTEYPELEGEILDWFNEYYDLAELPDITEFVRLGRLVEIR
jgi:hypothetical protein